MSKRKRIEDETVDLKDIKEEPAADVAIPIVPPPICQGPPNPPPQQEEPEEEDDFDDEPGVVQFDYVLLEFAKTMKAQAAGMTIKHIADLARDIGALYELQVGMNRNLNCATTKRQKIANSGTTLLHDLREKH